MAGILEKIERLCSDKSLLEILEKVEAGKRIGFDDGLKVLESNDLNTIGMIADYVK
jgi:2-iminoacetate synthase ThiH